jgi:hypothetical protein
LGGEGFILANIERKEHEGNREEGENGNVVFIYSRFLDKYLKTTWTVLPPSPSCSMEESVGTAV